jgi:outer membrane protein assembly complex protein YaeT
LFGVATALVPVAPAQNAGTSLDGRTILRILYNPVEQPLPRDEIDRLVPLRIGAPLDMDNVRSAIRRLYETGRYTDVAIDAEPENGGVLLRISTSFSYFLTSLTVDGADDPPSVSQLTGASKLELGGAITDPELTQASANMLERLRANGLYRAGVQHEIDRTVSTEEAAVTFKVEPGPRAHFDGVNISGQFSLPQSNIVRATGWHRGLGFVPLPGWREVTENRIQSGLEKIRQEFQKRDRLQARVTLDRLDYHEATNRVTPSVVVSDGPIIEVRVNGADISKNRLRQLIPIYQERTVDRALLIEGRQNLLEYLQSEGYFDAQVEFQDPTEQPDRSVIEYSVIKSERHKLAAILIQGNRYFDTNTLRERMYMAPASFPRRRFGRFARRLLDRDTDAIRDLYRSNGFREVEVTATVEDDYQGKDNDLAVHVTIREGPQSQVNSLRIEGVPESEAAELRSMVQSIEGQPYSEASIAADRDLILSRYFNDGYADATFDWTQTPGAEPNRVDLEYVIRPGERRYVRGVLVRGLRTTDRDLVDERISLMTGEPLSQNQIAQSQQRLYDLGIFAKVQTALQNPDGEEERKYVLFHMDEASKYSFNASVGAEVARIGGGITTFDSPAGTTGFSPRVSLGISRINFLGLGHTVGLQTLASNLRQRALLNYLAPQFKGQENLALTFSALFDKSRDVRTFTARRWEGSVQLSQRLSRANTVQYRYTFRYVTVDENTLKISEGLIPILAQPVRVGQVSLTLLQDRRDDPVDSRRGVYNTADLALAAGPLGSETSFTRLLLRNSTYHRITREVVLARSLQFGYIQRLGGLPQIPLPERFFAGGANSHRAFPASQAGPRDLDTGFPLGGSALLIHSTELRFPLFGDNIGGVLFHDMGNVYSDVRNISIRFRQRNLQDFDYMVHSAGFGIRYRTPIGPVRLDLSLSPNSPRFFGFEGTRDELLAGQGRLVDQRINVFQFHFSLGQTF